MVAALRSLWRARMHLVSGSLDLSSARSSCFQSLADGFQQISPLHSHRAPLIGQVALASALAPPSGADAARLLEKLRVRKIRDMRKPDRKMQLQQTPRQKQSDTRPAVEQAVLASSFQELMLSEELMKAVEELNLSKPTEVQCLGIPAIISGENVVLASHTGSGKTLAYMLPLVQCLRRDEMESGKLTRPRRPRAIVLCPTRELAEQVFHVAKSICHHARFRSAMIGGGCRMRPQEDALNTPIDMLVGTPGRLLMHVSEGNMAYGDIKYVVLDEADTMFDHGFGPEVQKFLGPLRNRSVKPGDEGFQTILVTATITKAVQKLLDTEFPGIRHLHTSTLHKKIPNARHGFIKLSGAENKLEALSQVLEPSIAKGDRVMVFCNTLNSCRAVDHFLSENNTCTVNYHGDVPAEQRVEGLNKFRSEDGNYRVLVCTDLAARGLDLVVDHVIMFDFPLNPIDYLHRTGRTARMGAKGKVTSLVSKKDLILARQIEESVQKGETIETLTANRAGIETAKKKVTIKRQKEKMGMVNRTKIRVMKMQAPTVKQKEMLRTTSMTKIATVKKQTSKVKQKEKPRMVVRAKIKTMKNQAPKVKPRHGKGDGNRHKSTTKGAVVHRLSSRNASVVRLTSGSANAKSGVKSVARDSTKKRVKRAIKI